MSGWLKNIGFEVEVEQRSVKATNSRRKERRDTTERKQMLSAELEAYLQTSSFLKRFKP